MLKHREHRDHGDRGIHPFNAFLVSVILVISVSLVRPGVAQNPPTASFPPSLDRHLPESTEAVYRALARTYDPARAMDVVVFMDRFWRLAGNEGFLASQQNIRQRLEAAGYESAVRSDASGDTARVWYEEFPNSGRGWDHTTGTLTLLGDAGAPDEVLLSRERHRVALCINSFSTEPGGLILPVVDVGQGLSEQDYAGTSVMGALVLGDAPIGRLWRDAVQQRGAVGVVSTDLPSYLSPDAPGASPTPRGQWEILQWGSIPYDEALRSFGFKSTPRAASRLRERLKQRPARVKVDIASTFSSAPNRSLIAEIPGRVAPRDRIMFVAHVQEPGANDDASGCGTLSELARTMLSLVKSGALPRPARTLTFMWVDEVRGSRQWLQDHAGEAAGVKYMFSLDMTGEDTMKTGGTFLIERAPDPAAVWSRPADPHTEWGRGDVKRDALRGTLLTDLHLAVCQRRARDNGWVVRTNPYEGGSDHTVFTQATIPAILDWHFTDRYYHTNLDRPDKTSPVEMANVGVAIGTTAWLLGNARVVDAKALGRLLMGAATARLDLEERQSRTLLSASLSTTTVATEREIFDAWKQWYAEALRAVVALPVGPRADELSREIDEAIEQLRERQPRGF